MLRRDGEKRIKEAAREGGGGATPYKANNKLFVFVRGSIGFSGFFMFFIDFIHIPCGNDACGQSHNGNAEHGRKHRDHTSERRDRIDVTVSDRGKGNRRPVYRVKEVLKRIRFHIEDDQRGDEDVSAGKRAHRNQRFPGGAEHIADNLKAF